MALDQVLEKQDHLESQNVKINLPALFRYEIAGVVCLINFANLFSCTARLIVLEMRESPAGDPTLRERACIIFERCKSLFDLAKNSR